MGVCYSCNGTGVYHHDAVPDEGLEAYDEECMTCYGKGVTWEDGDGKFPVFRDPEDEYE